VEVVAYLYLPTGRKGPLRALIDTGGTDNFINQELISKFNLPHTDTLKGESVSMGEDQAVTIIEGETSPLCLSIGPYCKHRSVFTILKLGDYDLILGRPFQKYSQCTLEQDDWKIPTKNGWKILPKWIISPTKQLRVMKVSTNQLRSEISKNKNLMEKSLLIFPKFPLDLTSRKLVSILKKNSEKNTKNKERHVTWENTRKLKKIEEHKNPQIQKKIEENKKQPQKEEKNNLDQIPRTKGIPELERTYQNWKPYSKNSKMCFLLTY